MWKKLLITLGLAKAPAPIRTYFAVSSFVGAIPALAYVAYKHRDKLRALMHRSTAQPELHPAS